MNRTLPIVLMSMLLMNPVGAIPYGPPPEVIQAEQDRALSLPMTIGFEFKSGMFRGRLDLKAREDGTVNGRVRYNQAAREAGYRNTSVAGQATGARRVSPTQFLATMNLRASDKRLKGILARTLDSAQATTWKMTLAGHLGSRLFFERGEFRLRTNGGVIFN